MRPCLLWGANTVDTRELHEDVLRGAQVIVEDVEAARREAGDVAIAVEKGALAWDDVVTMAEVVRGEVALDPARRVVFKTVGMPWEDLAVAKVIAGERVAGCDT
ncbi:ornithine cyclodeaminase [Corynebacterium gottingense]|nr:ornithine cyclodeaminase [Corynebacterium gottingense]WJZ15925.1 ornithine cyclodeaminase [Corynebacterium gottingense]